MNHYDPMQPITAQQYAIDARKIIKDILNRNKTPIIEGGSPFYINQIFNPQLTNFSDDTFKEARLVAKRIIELDGNKFNKTMARCEDLLNKLEVPKSEAKKIGENDFYRLETKMAFALYLQVKGLSY
jgi:tRNA A37 N6-isopentenylltransferase MiaA